MRSKFSLLVLLIILGIGFWWIVSHTGYVILNPRDQDVTVKDLLYEKYSFERLVERGGIASKIEIAGNKFYYQSEGRRISGEINLPSRPGLEGVVVMARGYVDKEIYKTGIGTHNAAKYFAEQGYVTLAPDFSGYGESDPEDPNALGARLSKPVEILDLIASIRANNDLPLQGAETPIFLWGHSNGGQIMLSVAEIIGKKAPSLPAQASLRGQSSQVRGLTLWAPVSKPFPYNILYYTDDASDSGKWLRGKVAEFEQDYDVFNYSIDRYLDWINIPVQIHQGDMDEAVPKIWSDNLAKVLKEKEKEVSYFVYPGANHNMKPGWNKVVERDVSFFTSLN